MRLRRLRPARPGCLGGESAGEVDEAGLVGDGEESAADGTEVGGSGGGRGAGEAH